MVLTRPLIAFAFLAEKFEETGDIAQGLMPLFAPIISAHKGKNFSSTQFAADVSNYYGIRVHPWAAEDWLGRLERERSVEKVPLAADLYSYRYVSAPNEIKTIQEADIERLLEAFSTHARKKFEAHGISISKDVLERGIFDRLVRMDFLNIILKPDSLREPPAYSSDTIRLPRSADQDEERERKELEAQIDFVCADFILVVSAGSPDLFELLVQIACGALVAEVILDFQAPTKKVEFKNLIVYLDAPFIMDLLDLSYVENVKYSGELYKQLKDTGARISVFLHSIDEIRGAIRAPLERFERGESATGPTGARLRSSAFRAYARSIVGSLEAEIKGLGISIAGTSSLGSPQSRQYFTQDEEEELSRNIGHYENVAARLRDAGSIANIIRLRQRADIPMHNFAACRAIFLTRNARLAEMSSGFLFALNVVGKRGVPPCIHDRYMAGLLWIVYGGKGKELSRQRLLANCASAIGPRQDVIKRMHGFLSDLDEGKARHFQALMTNNKAAHYLMSKALGDARLITKQNVTEIYEEVEQIAGEKVAREKDTEIKTLHAQHEALVKAKDDELGRTRVELEKRLAQSTNDSNQAIRTALEEVYSAREEALAAQIAARSEKQRADDFARQVATLMKERERTNLLALERAVGFARGIRRRAQREVLAGIVLASIVLGIASSFAPLLFSEQNLGVYLTTLVCIFLSSALSAVQFWIFPEHLFGAYVVRKRDAALFRKARELNVSDLLDSYEIEWTSGSVRKRNLRE